MRRGLLFLAALAVSCSGGVQTTQKLDMNGPAAQGTAVATFAAG